MLFGGEGVYSMMKENSTIKSYEFLIQGQNCDIGQNCEIWSKWVGAATKIHISEIKAFQGTVG